MARPRKARNVDTGTENLFVAWAETLGEALGRGVARGIDEGMNRSGGLRAAKTASAAPAKGRAPGRRRGPGRPPASGDRQCKVPGCKRELRSKGLCSAHYQAERRKQLGS